RAASSATTIPCRCTGTAANAGSGPRPSTRSPGRWWTCSPGGCRHEVGHRDDRPAGAPARPQARARVAAARARHRGQRRPRPARRARRATHPGAGRRRAGAVGHGDPHRRPGAVRGDPAALGPWPQARHRAGQRHRADRRGLPGPAADQRVEPRPRTIHHRTGRPHRAAGAAAGGARPAAGRVYFRRECARRGRLRPHRRALTPGNRMSMTTKSQPNKARVYAQLRPWLPVLAAILALLAAWLAWSGWRALQEDSRRTSVSLARDTVVGLISGTVRDDVQALRERIAAAPVVAALREGDLEAAAAAAAAGWDEAEVVEFHPPALDRTYAALPDGGFGPVSVMEAALMRGEPVVSVIRAGGGPRVGLAAPVQLDEATVAVAFARLPITRVTAALDATDVDPATYVAVRQGGFTLQEKGDPAQAEAAERMAVPVPGTDLRVAASLPRTGGTPFGLEGIPLFAVVAVLLVLAYLLWRLPARVSRALEGPPPAEQPPERTLVEALSEEPAADEAAAPPPVEATEDTPPPPPAVDIDRGIFRAYDIRGIVGQSLDAGIAELIGHSVGSLMAEQDLREIV